MPIRAMPTRANNQGRNTSLHALMRKGCGVGRRFPQRCSKSEKYDTAVPKLFAHTMDDTDRIDREVLDNSTELESGEA